MANGDLLRKLFQSYQRRDQQAFQHYARQVIEEERQKNHNLLADDLERILDGVRPRTSPRAFESASPQLTSLPREDSGGEELVEVRAARAGVHDIVLNDVNIQIVESIIREHRRIDVLRTYGLSPRCKLLFCGPPGCGKSLCAEVIAHELELPIVTLRYDALVSSLLGETASNLRKVFDFVKTKNWVLLLDDFEALAKRRDDPTEHGEIKRLINSLLQLLDSVQSPNVVIATTNHEQLVDPALWRRFDEVLYFGRPSEGQILEFLERKFSSFPHQDTTLALYVPQLSGMTYADIERICNDARTSSVLDGARQLRSIVFQEAIENQRRRMMIISGDRTSESMRKRF